MSVATELSNLYYQKFLAKKERENKDADKASRYAELIKNKLTEYWHLSDQYVSASCNPSNNIYNLYIKIRIPYTNPTHNNDATRELDFQIKIENENFSLGDISVKIEDISIIFDEFQKQFIKDANNL